LAGRGLSRARSEVCLQVHHEQKQLELIDTPRFETVSPVKRLHRLVFGEDEHGAAADQIRCLA
jgi:hypothetical protein